MPSRSLPRTRSSYRVATGYAAAQLALWGVSFLVASGTGSVIREVSAGLGAATLAISIVLFRPGRPVGWWLLAAGGLSVFAPEAVLLFAAGLGVLGWRRNGSNAWADVLDAVTAAAAAVLLVWILAPGAGDRPQVGLIPIGGLLVFAAAVKLVLSIGLRTPAITIVMIAAMALAGATLDVYVPDVYAVEIHGERVSQLLWSAPAALLGSAATHPSFVQVARAVSWGTSLSAARVAMIAMIAVILPLALALGLIDRPVGRERTVAAVVTPTAAAAAGLLSLVGRLALIGRVAQRRADQLTLRSADLAAAVAKQEKLRGELTHRAMHDPLTGLSNRVLLANRLEDALHGGDPAPVALLLLDLDGFKEINDTYGHPIGDDLLRAVARRLVETFPADATVARLGGDEFAVLIAAAPAEQARRYAETILARIAEPFVVEGHNLYLSVSIGLLATQTVITPSEALNNADLALYSAKHSGRNRVVLFRAELRDERARQVRIRAGLERAIAARELDVEYQPIVELASGRVLAVEALVRWRPNGKAEIPPSQFIPVAEATGLIDAIGDHVLRQACTDVRSWRERHHTAVSVNVSPHQLDDPRFAEMVLDTLASVGLPTSALILEITENSLVNGGHRIRQLERLHASGVRIAIDDFGTGYSSLASISRLPVTFVKLDQSFMPSGGEPNWAFTSAILEALASVGLHAIAEGVETSAQAAALLRTRCKYAQGFHFHRPISRSAVASVLDGAHLTGHGPTRAGSAAD